MEKAGLTYAVVALDGKEAERRDPDASAACSAADFTERPESADAKRPGAGPSPMPAAPPATNEHVRKSMQGNKRKDTKPELLMRERLRKAGLTGYRLQWKVPGRPDIAWPGKRVAIQVLGCFWHRCPHCHPPVPKSHVEYWVVKFERNVERDERTRLELQQAGWTVHEVWECQLKKKTIDGTIEALFPQLARELGKQLAEGWDKP